LFGLQLFGEIISDRMCLLHVMSLLPVARLWYSHICAEKGR